MRRNATRARLIEGQPAFGIWTTLSDPAVVEMIGLAGYHFAILDMEHVSTSFALVEQMIRACDVANVTSLVRVPDKNPNTILRVLDSGAEGIMIPHVMSAADAQSCVAACRYPPLGTRGISATSRANRYSFGDFDAYAQDANRETLVVAMIEDQAAVDQSDQILQTRGLDVAFIAPYDLAGSLGLLGRPGDPQLEAAVDHILSKRSARGPALGMPAHHPIYTRSVTQLLSSGFRFVPTAFDVGLLAAGMRADVADWRAAEGM